MTALLPISGGAVLTGGSDRAIRFWDGSWPERSYIVAGPVWPNDTGIIEPTTNRVQVRYLVVMMVLLLLPLVTSRRCFSRPGTLYSLQQSRTCPLDCLVATQCVVVYSRNAFIASYQLGLISMA